LNCIVKLCARVTTQFPNADISGGCIICGDNMFCVVVWNNRCNGIMLLLYYYWCVFWLRCFVVSMLAHFLCWWLWFPPTMIVFFTGVEDSM